MHGTQTATRKSGALDPARQNRDDDLNYETGRGYFRHPVSPLAAVRESFLPFIEQPANDGVDTLAKASDFLQNPFSRLYKARFAQVLTFSSRICTNYAIA